MYTHIIFYIRAYTYISLVSLNLHTGLLISDTEVSPILHRRYFSISLKVLPILSCASIACSIGDSFFVKNPIFIRYFFITTKFFRLDSFFFDLNI